MTLKNLISAEKRRLFLNNFRMFTYYSHPELKIKENIYNPNKRWQMLLTMRDLRLWVQENAPFSSRKNKQIAEIYHINQEINYLQQRAMTFPFVFIMALTIYFTYWSSDKYRGALGSYGRPTIQHQTGGMSFLHDGTVPKMTTIETSELLGM